MTMRIAVVFCFLWLLATPTLSMAQYPNIRVSDVSSTDPEEITLSINPVNPLNLAAGANIDHYYYTFDGGWTWEEGTLTSSSGVFGDPCIVFDANGDLHYGHLSNPPSPGYWLDRIVVQKSTDGGVTWSDGVGVGYHPPKQQDKDWLAVDLTDSPYRNTIYAAWTEFDVLDSSDPADSSRVLLSRSTDGGLTWSAPIRISDRGGSALDDDSTVEGAVPAIGPNGEVYVTWAGNSFIYFDKSTDGGATFGSDVIVTAQPGGWVFSVPGIYRCNGWPVAACDVSDSPYQGHVYISWSDQRHGFENTDVFLIKSTDGGSTWGDITQVNDDTGIAHQFFPWMSVDPLTGHVYLVFYDRRGTAGNATDVYVAESEDGGATFRNFKVSDSSFTPVASVFFGDYISIAARNGKIYPIWTRMDGTDLSLWTALIDESGENVVLNGSRLRQNYPNPFRPHTTIEFTLPSPANVSLAVYDVGGGLVKVLANGRYSGSPTEITWNGTDEKGHRVSSGVYFCRLQTPYDTHVKKMVLVR